ncbi:hypothetical protein M3M39_00035 [Fructilactobacillus hinvesii]|uniref:Lipoprotein n=1 Tax=Fructilactobacillus hinvesii TaxID=2940300 RepID=A0ABY5BTZ5_9LACO|nr:hypothetical protein [Fructilactobacillus hinvesii]USS87917.1 hypothetical protein M3M39_00035 [Fructilactobacillus hinvesii]
MKKWIWGIIIVVIVAVFGGWMYAGHSNGTKAYASQISSGKSALNDANYSKAKDDFQAAVDKKPKSKEANALLNQTQHFIDGNDQMKDKQFTNAKQSYCAVKDEKNGSNVMVKRANGKVKTVNEVIKNDGLFKKIYKEAVKQHNDKKYDASNQTLQGILTAHVINQKYYSDIKQKAKDLKKSNDKALKKMTTDQKKASAMNVQQSPAVTQAVNQVSSTQEAVKANAQSSNSAAAAVKKQNQTAMKATNSTSGNQPTDPNSLNVYSNPSEYSNRFVDPATGQDQNTSTSTNATAGDNSGSQTGQATSPDTNPNDYNANNDPYNVYSNPGEYSNRFN